MYLNRVFKPKAAELPVPLIRNSVNPSAPLDLSFATFEIAREDEPESLTTRNANQAVQPPSENSQRDTAPWILASRKLQVPQKPMDTQFKLHLADLR